MQKAPVLIFFVVWLIINGVYPMKHNIVLYVALATSLTTMQPIHSSDPELEPQSQDEHWDQITPLFKKIHDEQVPPKTNMEQFIKIIEDREWLEIGRLLKIIDQNPSFDLLFKVADENDQDVDYLEEMHEMVKKIESFGLKP